MNALSAVLSNNRTIPPFLIIHVVSKLFGVLCVRIGEKESFQGTVVAYEMH